MPSYVDRLWSKALADGTGCWLWQGAVNANVYERQSRANSFSCRACNRENTRRYEEKQRA